MPSTHSPQSTAGLTVAKSSAIAPKYRAQYTYSHLRFRLGSYGALLPTRQVLEAVTMPTSGVTPMPNMPPAMLGLINRRSQVLWVADLALLLDIPVAYPNSQQYNLVILQLGQTLIALRVQEINSILSLPPDQVSPAPSHVPAGLVPFLRGCFLQANEVLLVLNAEAIVRSPTLQPDS